MFDGIVETPPALLRTGGALALHRFEAVDREALRGRNFGALVGRTLKERGFRKLSARPKHPEAGRGARGVLANFARI